MIPGRLLRVRFPLGTSGRMLSLICAYQHAWAPRDAHILDKRAEFWQNLSRCIGSVPHTELLIVGGDLNVQLSPQHPHVGHGTGALSAERAPDAAAAHTVLSTHSFTHSLIALNTCGAPNNKARTFKFGKHRAQLDYLITRQSQCTREAKQASPLVDTERIIQLAQIPDPSAIPEIASFRSELATQLDHVRTVADAGTISDIVQRVAATHFPKAQPNAAKITRWQQSQTRMGIKDMWKAWRYYRRSTRDTTLRAIIGRWRTWTQHYKLYKQHKETCRTTKKAYILEQMQIAEQVICPAVLEQHLRQALCSDIAANTVCSVLDTQWTQTSVTVPADWSDAHLVLLKTPAKTGKEVDLIGTHYGVSSTTAMKSEPNAKPNTVTLDLAGAFDAMPRHLLLTSMQNMKLPSMLIQIVMSWHQNAHYHINHDGTDRVIHATQGVRQGCAVAPLLWLIFSHHISESLAAKIGYQATIDLLSIFADDYHCSGIWHTEHELEETLLRIAALLRVLADKGMLVNALDDYSCVLFLQPDAQGPLPLLYKAAQRWKQAQEANQTTTALRTTLFGCLIQMLHTGLKSIGTENPTPFQAKAEEMKWLKDGHWCCQKWLVPALGSLVA
ncbi:unnamed protein product [Symbiodinium sp. CCMP2592]|nr:unnamed protein product [Symbiodinium sp. CCMP2592]